MSATPPTNSELDRFRDQADSFIRDLDEEYYLHFAGLKETLDVLSDPDLMRQIRQSEADIAAGRKGLSFEEVFGEPLGKNRRKKRR